MFFKYNWSSVLYATVICLIFVVLVSLYELLWVLMFEGGEESF